MAKSNFDVDVIKEEAKITLRSYHGQREGSIKALTVRQLRMYAGKVLFLCKQIEKLKKAKQ